MLYRVTKCKIPNIEYQQVKQEIQSNLAQLQTMLTNTQYDEICHFLNEKYILAASVALNKASKRLDQRGPGKFPQNKQRAFQAARIIYLFIWGFTSL